MRTNQEQAAYENAWECLWAGYGREYWNSCGLTGEKADEIWLEAKAEITSYDPEPMGKQYAYTMEDY